MPILGPGLDWLKFKSAYGLVSGFEVSLLYCVFVPGVSASDCSFLSPRSAVPIQSASTSSLNPKVFLSSVSLVSGAGFMSDELSSSVELHEENCVSKCLTNLLDTL